RRRPRLVERYPETARHGAEEGAVVEIGRRDAAGEVAFGVEREGKGGAKLDAESEHRVKREIAHVVAEGFAGRDAQTREHLHDLDAAGRDDTRIGSEVHVVARLGPVPIVGSADAETRDEGGVKTGGSADAARREVGEAPFELRTGHEDALGTDPS